MEINIMGVVLTILNSFTLAYWTSTIRKIIINRKFKLQRERHGAFYAKGLKELKVDMVKVCKNIRQIDNDKLYNFLQVMSTKHEDYDFNIFYKNLMSLRIDKDDNVKKEKLGDYNSKLNKITVYNDIEGFCVIEHELLHASSVRKTRNVTYIGFQQVYKNKKELGRGLNEGYTNLLARRYFGTVNLEPSEGSYPLQSAMASLIESLVGKNKMESLYFNADLKGLIDELEQYFPKEKISELISLLDVIHFYSSNKLDLSEDEIKSMVKEIDIWITKIETQKLLKERNNKKK